jgi:hypothetical protein
MAQAGDREDRPVRGPARRSRRTSKADIVRVPLRWEGYEEVPFLYASQVFVRLSEDGQVLLTFGHVEHLFEVSPSKETIDRIKRDGLLVRVVARLVVSPQALSGIIGHLDTIREESQRRLQPAPPQGTTRRRNV